MMRPMRPMRRYSALSLLRARFAGNRHWRPLWTGQKLKEAYDVVVVGAGGHGLATAFHLARDHGNPADRRARQASARIGQCRPQHHDRALQLPAIPKTIISTRTRCADTKRCRRDLNYNVMYSPRGVVDLALSDDDFPALARRGNAMRLAGIDAELMDLAALERFCPELEPRRPRRFPIKGALVQRRGGTVRHDAVAWAYARGASALGVDIIENCEVTGVRVRGGRGNRRRDQPRPCRGRAHRVRYRRAHRHDRHDARRAAAHRDASAAGHGHRADQAAAAHRADLRVAGPRRSLRRPIRPRRSGHGRPPGWLSLVHARRPSGTASRMSCRARSNCCRRSAA